MISTRLTLFLIPILLIPAGCYSFKGISISPDTETFQVNSFDVKVANAPAAIDQRFVEGLRNKIRSETRLSQNANRPDIEFSGSIVRYDVTSEAPTADQTSAINRLEIEVEVKYVNHLHEDKNWTQRFSFFNNYESTQSLSEVQDQLIENIFDELTERIFNKAFTDW